MYKFELNFMEKTPFFNVESSRVESLVKVTIIN